MFFILKETTPCYFEKTKNWDYKQEVWRNEILEEGTSMIDIIINIEGYMAMPKYKDFASYDVVYGRPSLLEQEFYMDRAIYCKNYEEVIRIKVQNKKQSNLNCTP